MKDSTLHPLYPAALNDHAGMSLSKQRLRVWLRMLDRNRNFLNRLRTSLRDDFETTLPRFDVLAALDHHPEGLNMSELSRFVMMSNGNVTGIAHRLVEEGLVRRHTDAQDGRVQVLRMTVAGKQQFDTMAIKHAAWIDALLAPMTGQDVGHVMALLDKVKNHVGEQHE